MARPLPGHLPRQDASPPAGGDGGSVERTFRADRGRPSFAGHANDTDLSAQPVDRTGRWLASLTRWVLAHKRLVAVGWLALTLVGFYGAAKVTDALNENFTMPDSASTVTNERIVSRFDSGGATPPLVAVVTLPPGTTASAPAVRADLRGTRAGPRARRPRRSHRVLRLHIRAGLRLRRRPHHVRDRASAVDRGRRRRAERERDQRRDAGARRASRRRRARGRRRGTAHGCRAAGPRGARRGRRSQLPERDAPRRRRGTDRAGVRLRVRTRRRTAADGDRRDPGHAAGRLGAHRADRGQPGRRLPRLADRPRRRDRLRAPDRHALARGTRARAKQRAGDRARRRNRRARGAVQRHHRGDRTALGARAARCRSCARWATAACSSRSRPSPSR